MSVETRKHHRDPSGSRPQDARWHNWGIPRCVLRRINSKGRPNVKIGASEQGAGTGRRGELDPTYVQILSEWASISLKLTNKDGREQIIKPRVFWTSPAIRSIDEAVQCANELIVLAKQFGVLEMSL